MQRTVICNQCGMKLGVPATADGQRIQCPSCRFVFTVAPTPSNSIDFADHAGADSSRDSSVLAWACVCIVTLALAGGIGALIWQLTHCPAADAEPLIAAAVETNQQPAPPPAQAGSAGLDLKAEVAVPSPDPPTVKNVVPVPPVQKKEPEKVEQSQPANNKGEQTVELDASARPAVPATVVAQAPPAKAPAEDKEPVGDKKKPEKKEVLNPPKVVILDANHPGARTADATGTSPGVLSPGGPSQAGLINKVAGRLNANVGAVFDVDAKAALLLLPGGSAKLFDYPTFRPLGSYKLDGGTAYFCAFDKAKGRLYVLSRDTKAKEPTGKPGGSQLVWYDVRSLLDGRLKPRAELAPAKVISLGGFCTNLCLSPDGAWLYALDAQALKVVRVNVVQEKVDATVAVPPFTESVWLANNGKRLYALAHTGARTPKGPIPKGVVGVIDAPLWKLVKTITIDADPFALAATNDGIVFASGRGGVRSEITVLDVNKEPAVVAMWRNVPPNTRLKLADDEKSLFVSLGGSAGFVASLTLPDALAGSEAPQPEWNQAMPMPGRGDVIVTPDHQFLLCDSGVILYLAAGK